MNVLRVYIDGLQFDVTLNDSQITSEALEKSAESLREYLPKLDGMSMRLVDGSFLVLGEQQLKRAVFVYVVDTKAPQPNN